MTDPVAPAVDLEELRRLAEAALWSEDELRDDWWPLMVDSLNIEDEQDAAYIAAANPQTILRLLDGSAGYVLVNADRLAPVLRKWMEMRLGLGSLDDEYGAAAAILAALQADREATRG